MFFICSSPNSGEFKQIKASGSLEQKGPVEDFGIWGCLLFRGLLLGVRGVHLVFGGMHCVFGILGRIKQLVHWEHQQTGQVEDFGMLGYLGGLLLQFRDVHLVSRG